MDATTVRNDPLEPKTYVIEWHDGETETITATLVETDHRGNWIRFYGPGDRGGYAAQLLLTAVMSSFNGIVSVREVVKK